MGAGDGHIVVPERRQPLTERFSFRDAMMLPSAKALDLSHPPHSPVEFSVVFLGILLTIPRGSVGVYPEGFEMAAIPPASPSISSASVPAQTQIVPSGSASISSSSSSSISSVSSQSRPVSTVSSVSSSSVISSSSIPSSSSHTSAQSTVVVITPGPPHNDGPPQNNNISVIVPIAAIACGFIIVYFAYRLYILHKRRKDDPTPLPPPRTPAILEQGRQSVMYANPQAAPASLSHRNSMRPASFIYAPSQSNSSLALSKGQYTSASGHSTPTHPPTYTPDETGRFSPLPPPSIRAHSRPHSVASFTSARQSMYGTPTLRGQSYLNRVDIVLPQPLGAQPYTPTSPAPRQRHSMYSPTSNPELRHSFILPPAAATLSPPASSNGVSREEDWTERIAATEDAESASTCTAHQRPSSPPSPPSSKPTMPSSYSPNPRGFTPSPSLDLHVPGAFPPSIRGRSMSPPEPLLSSNAFLGSTGSGESDEDRTPRK